MEECYHRIGAIIVPTLSLRIGMKYRKCFVTLSALLTRGLRKLRGANETWTGFSLLRLIDISMPESGNNFDSNTAMCNKTSLRFLWSIAYEMLPSYFLPRYLAYRIFSSGYP